MKTLDFNQMENVQGGGCGVEDAAWAVGFAALGAFAAVVGGPAGILVGIELGVMAADIAWNC